MDQKNNNPDNKKAIDERIAALKERLDTLPEKPKIIESPQEKAQRALDCAAELDAVTRPVLLKHKCQLGCYPNVMIDGKPIQWGPIPLDL